MYNKDFIRKDYKSEQNKERNMKNIRALYDIAEKNKYTIDDETWNDLEMDYLFEKMDRTYSSEGEQVLYTILRNPLVNEEQIKKRSDLIHGFSYDEELRTKLRYILFMMKRDKKNIFFEMMDGLLLVNKVKYFVYSILGKVIPVILIVLAIALKEPKFMIGLMVSVFINIAINQYERDKIRGTGLLFLRDLLLASKKISRIKDDKISSYTIEIKNILKKIKKIDRGTVTLKILTVLGGVLEIFSIPFLIEETTYYKISDKIKANEGLIFKLYYLIGELDALISIASYKDSNKDKICTPTFIEEKELYIKEGIVPFIKNPVPNTLYIKKKGIVLTGTNMSGKSTFLRMVAINVLLAQSFNFCLAKEYKGCFLNLVSSISPKDDINNGKSYYLAEAEGILRIIKALDDNITVFCPIDEIFRGTNPVERISSSAEILKYINERNALTIVATHDRELTEILKEEYDFFYFSEEVKKEEGLKFDYKLKKGVNKNRNAIKLLEYIGYPKEIVENSFKRSETLDKYI